VVEQFLYREADLLDRWELDRWLELLEPGASYLVPSTDRPDGDPDVHQFLIADTYAQVVARVRRLKSRLAHAERPRSRTRRFISNVLVDRQTGDELAVRASFQVWRFKDDRVATYVGQYQHVLTMTDDGLRFRRRTAVLDLESLRDEGRISIIL
jgi:p-cumate 2,3-dioxygenase beta subunit